VHTPYTATPEAAFLVAHTATGATAIALTWTQRRALAWGAPLAFAAIASAMIASPLPGFLVGLHRPMVEPDLTMKVLRWGAWCFLGAALLSRGSIAAKLLASVIHVLALEGNEYFTDSLKEMCIMHLSLGMAMLGLVTRTPLSAHAAAARPRDDDGADFAQDLAHFLVPMTFAILVGKYVLRWGIDSSDEWAYTFQASTFAKFHAYSVASPCDRAFQNFWVFDWGGKRFSQYTPGWPLFMVPFVWTRTVWLAGPTSLGLLGVGIGRLARRFVEGPAKPWAASLAVAALSLSSTCLINGGSRFSHLWVAACFSWSLEALLRVGEVTSRRARIGWGVTFGFAVAWLLATRVGDGLLLGVGIFVLFVVQVVRRRIPLVAFVSGLASAALLGGWTLWVLHEQLGTWFTTGYSLSTEIYPWNKFEMKKPEPAEWKWGIPLATGAYCWFPAATSLGFFGLGRAARGARTLAVAILVSITALFVFYSWLDLGHGFDWGYGPRYTLPTIVAWAVGTGAAIAAPSRAVVVGMRRWIVAPTALAFATTAVLGTVALAPMLYPINTDSVMKLEEVNDRVRDAGLRHAVVIVQQTGTGERGGLDYTQNLPLDLYRDQNVLIAQPTGSEYQCLRDRFPDREFWEARGNPVQLVPLP
jgi:hypothetical protein